jgi:RimJ/RimL family protein N-acetyltransferase
MSTRPVKPEEMAWMTARSTWIPTGAARGILQEENGRIVAMVVFDEWTPHAARMHVAIDKPMSCREFVHAAFEYPFLETGRGLLLATIPDNNAACVRLVQRLGFYELAPIVDGWAPGIDLRVFEMRKTDCRWVRRAKN